MLKFFLSFFPSGEDKKSAASSPSSLSEPPTEIYASGVGPFPLEHHLLITDGLPYLDWQAVTDWIGTIENPEAQAKAWSDCETAWLLYLRDALGASFTLSENDDAALLSSLEPNVARATLEFMSKTLHRIERVLDGIARTPEWGKDILVVFDDDVSYYQYVSHYYPESGEFGGSSGVYVSAGCGHYVTMKSDMHSIEPVIAHEMTHGCLSHLPIPMWLNEGIAVNTEQRVSQSPRALYSVAEIRDKHFRFWNVSRIQDFWSGKSFFRNDDGNLLSYDLAQKIVGQLSSDWEAFGTFVLAAEEADGGSSAAAEHLNVDIGAIACVIAGHDPSPDWSPGASNETIAQPGDPADDSRAQRAPKRYSILGQAPQPYANPIDSPRVLCTCSMRNRSTAS